MGVNACGAMLTCIILCLGGCSLGVDHSHVLEVGIEADPVTLDPRVASDAFGDKIGQLIFSGLFRKDEQMNVVPDLAERYEQVSETSYRVFLRPGIHFHNGDALTADDVVYTIRSILDDEVMSPYKAAFSRVAAVVAEDPLTVRFDLSEPYAPFLTSLCRGIVPRKTAKELKNEFGRHPIGTGPYRFISWVPGASLELQAFAESEGGKPKIPRLVFRIIKEDNTRVLKLMKGDLDLVLNGVPLLLLDKIKTQEKLEVKTGSGIVLSYIGLNLSDPILKDVRVRKAIALGINRDEIIHHRRNGLAEKANSLLAPTDWAYAHGLEQLPYDPEAAKRLLDAAGYRDPDGNGPKLRMTLSFKTSTVKERIDIVRMIAEQLAKIGIGLKVESYEWGTFFRDVRDGNFQLYSLQWVGVIEPDMFFDVFHSSQIPPQGLNRGHYHNAKLDRLVEEGRRTLDVVKRRDIYDKVQRLLFVDVPMIPLWYEHNVVVYRKGLTGVSLRPDASFQPLMDVAKK